MRRTFYKSESKVRSDIEKLFVSFRKYKKGKIPMIVRPLTCKQMPAVRRRSSSGRPGESVQHWIDSLETALLLLFRRQVMSNDLKVLSIKFFRTCNAADDRLVVSTRGWRLPSLQSLIRMNRTGILDVIVCLKSPYVDSIREISRVGQLWDRVNSLARRDFIRSKSEEDSALDRQYCQEYARLKLQVYASPGHVNIGNVPYVAMSPFHRVVQSSTRIRMRGFFLGSRFMYPAKTTRDYKFCRPMVGNKHCAQQQ